MVFRRLLPVVLLFSGFAHAGAEPPDSKDKAKYKVTDDEKTIFELTNKERKANDKPVFKLNLVLCAVARAHSENMAKQEKMEHELDGKTPADRVKAASYLYSSMAENIASGDRWELSTVVQAWMDSKPHRENILSDKQEIGVGIATDAKGKVYFTQVFGTPRKKGSR
jgi:uncharacterized protein YkwD